MLPIIEQMHTVNAPVGAVIAGFSDVAVLKAAIPRCKDLRRLSDTKFWILTDIGVLAWTFQVEGIVTLRFDGAQIQISSDLRTKAFRLGRADTVITLTDVLAGAGASAVPDAPAEAGARAGVGAPAEAGARGKTVVHSKTTLLPARQHSVLMRRTVVAVARKLLDSFFLGFKPLVTA